jgi:hypothetical protein
MQLVAANDVDTIPDDLPDDRRFYASAVRAAAHPSRASHFTVVVYSENARTDAGTGACRVAHIADGHDDLSDRIVFSGRDVNNGWSLAMPPGQLAATFDHLSVTGFGSRPTVVWDGHTRRATFYPSGVDSDDLVILSVPLSSATVTQDEVCGVLNELYNEGLKTPSAHTAKIWVSGAVNTNLEDEIERHLKSSVQAHFSGRANKVKIIAQTTTSAGRTDLILLQRSANGSGPVMAGVLELKVLRGSMDGDVTLEGLQQGHAYRTDLELPFATLVLYDVGRNKTHETDALLSGVESSLLDAVRVRRFPLYKTPQEWRQAGNYIAR